MKQPMIINEEKSDGKDEDIQPEESYKEPTDDKDVTTKYNINLASKYNCKILVVGRIIKINKI